MSLLHDAAAVALRRLDPETAHGLTIAALKAGLGPHEDGPDDPALSVDIAGMHLPNCLGLAAGFDKNAEAPDAMLAADPGLRAEFEAKLAADPKFAASPGARLAWFYKRTPFYDDRYLLYPIARDL